MYLKLNRNKHQAYASLSVKQFDTHCTPNENIVMETGGREAFVIGRSMVNLKMLNVPPV